MTASAKSPKINKNDVLAAMDRRDMTFYDRLSPEDKKAFSPLVMMRWFSSSRANQEYNLYVVNAAANLNFFDIWQEPGLQYRLLASCGRGRVQRHDWIAMSKGGTETTRLESFLLTIYPNANGSELAMMIDLTSRAEFRTLLDDCAVPEREARDLAALFDKAKGRDV